MPASGEKNDNTPVSAQPMPALRMLCAARLSVSMMSEAAEHLAQTICASAVYSAFAGSIIVPQPLHATFVMGSS